MAKRTLRLYSLSLLVVLPASIVEAADPIQMLNEQYTTESREIASKGVSAAELREFHESWLSVFRSAIQEHPDSPLRVLALERSTELANGTGRYGLSLELLDQRLALANTPSARMNLFYQKGEVAKYAYGATRDVSYARQAVEHFSTLDQMIGRYYPAGDAHGVQLAISLSHIARLTGEALDDHERAAALYARSHQVLERLGRAERERMGASWPKLRESTLSGAAVEYTRSGRPERARKALASLNELKERQQPMGLHLLSVLSVTEAPAGELMQFVESWYLNAGADDRFAPHVALAIGQRLLNSGKPDLQARAADWFEMLLTDHENLLLGDSQEKGIAMQAIRSLADTYDLLGRSEDAAAARERLRTVDQEAGGQ